ncbi:hypothetical protein Salmuc_00954 [Salipiger mucosus DSM 16094]|uniref:Uncharacterized protein n=1 Tax=Salipiger mucosus DSM 16094 TaxID=1123237 RepID=S9RXA2_9RHOB|nr:hypothetical protein Salmuc_00954 [Salipiger mucosus DSM 16094]
MRHEASPSRCRKSDSLLVGIPWPVHLTRRVPGTMWDIRHVGSPELPAIAPTF